MPPGAGGSYALAQVSRADKDKALQAMAKALRDNAAGIVAAMRKT